MARKVKRGFVASKAEKKSYRKATPAGKRTMLARASQGKHGRA